MIPQGVAKRYATALLNAALKADIADEVHKEAIGFRAILGENEPFKNFLLSPQTPTKDKKELIKTTLGGRSSELFVALITLLIDKKRVNFVEEIIEGYNYLYERHEGVVEVKVVTAIKLDASTKKRVIEKLESETGKEIRIVPVTDPDIIGGMILIMEDKIIDGSIRFHMEKIKRKLDEIRI